MGERDRDPVHWRVSGQDIDAQALATLAEDHKFRVRALTFAWHSVVESCGDSRETRNNVEWLAEIILETIERDAVELHEKAHIVSRERLNSRERPVGEAGGR